MYFDSHKETNESTLFVVEGDDDRASVVGVLAVGAGAVVGAMGGGAVGGAAGAPGVLSHRIHDKSQLLGLLSLVAMQLLSLYCSCRFESSSSTFLNRSYPGSGTPHYIH